MSPRVGHIHVTVDDAPWHFVDASGETLIVVGLEPGPHKILIELADPTHRVIMSETVSFKRSRSAEARCRVRPAAGAAGNEPLDQPLEVSSARSQLP